MPAAVALAIPQEMLDDCSGRFRTGQLRPEADMRIRIALRQSIRQVEEVPFARERNALRKSVARVRRPMRAGENQLHQLSDL